MQVDAVAAPAKLKNATLKAVVTVMFLVIFHPVQIFGPLYDKTHSGQFSTFLP